MLFNTHAIFIKKRMQNGKHSFVARREVEVYLSSLYRDEKFSASHMDALSIVSVIVDCQTGVRGLAVRSGGSRLYTWPCNRFAVRYCTVQRQCMYCKDKR